MANVMLEARGVRKEFFRKGRQSARYFDAVPATDLSVALGDVVVLKGRSGSGKTTLLNMLGGLLEPTEGSVLFCGDNLYALGDVALSRLRNRHFGVVAQGQTALHSLTIEENVLLPLTLYGSADADDGVRHAEELLERLGILELRDSYPAELSGGELRRMAIARALVVGPDAIFADEPTGDLDDANTQVVLDLLKGEAARGAAVVMATHESIPDGFATQVLELNPA